MNEIAGFPPIDRNFGLVHLSWQNFDPPVERPLLFPFFEKMGLLKALFLALFTLYCTFSSVSAAPLPSPLPKGEEGDEPLALKNGELATSRYSLEQKVLCGEEIAQLFEGSEKDHTLNFFEATGGEEEDTVAKASSVFLDLEVERVDDTVNLCGKNSPITLGEAVWKTLQNQNKIKIAVDVVDKQRGVVQELAGPFDSQTSLFVENSAIANSQSPDIATKLNGDITQLGVAGTKQFRSGTNLSVEARIEQVKDPGNYLIPYNRGDLSLAMTQPLLRGFLYGPEATEERAGLIAYKALYYRALHDISELILTTIIDYWNLVEAQEIVAIRKETLDAFLNLYEKTKLLVKGNQLAQSELNQPLANFYNAQLNYVQAMQQLYIRIQKLQLSLGTIPTTTLSTNGLMATEELPSSDEVDKICSYMNGLVELALRSRNDLISLSFTELEYKQLLKGASNELLPELDLIAEYHMSNYKRGPSSRKFLSSTRISSPNRKGVVGLSLSMPISNNGAKGRYRQISSQLRSITYQLLDSKKEITSEVMELVMNHRHLMNEISSAEKAVYRYQKLVDDEGERLKNGIGSLFNLIDYENNYSTVKESLTSVKRDYAENLAKLYFSTGLLLHPSSNLCEVEVNDMRRLPFSQGAYDQLTIPK